MKTKSGITGIRIFVLLLCMVNLQSIVSAQKGLEIIEKSGEKSYVEIANVKKITFEQGKLLIYKKDDSSEDFFLNNIQLLHFEDKADEIESHTILPDNKVSLFPNPAVDFLTIQYFLSGNSISYFEIKNMNGQIVDKFSRSGNCGINETRFNIAHLSPGMYICRLNVNGSVSIIKFIKSN